MFFPSVKGAMRRKSSLWGPYPFRWKTRCTVSYRYHTPVLDSVALQEKLERERRRRDVESRAEKMMDHLSGKVRNTISSYIYIQLASFAKES